MTLRILRSVEEVETLRSFWSSSPGLRDSDIEMYLSGLRNTGVTLRPHVLVVYRGGEPSALMAGRIDRRRLAFRVGYFNLFKPLANVLTFPYGGLRGDACSENCEQLIGGIIESLRNCEADVAILEYLDADSTLFRLAQRAPAFLFRDYFSPTRPHRKREIAASSEQFYSGLSSNERKHFRKIAKKLANDFPGRIRVAYSDDPVELARMLQIVEDIAKKTWQRRLGHGFEIYPSLLDSLKTQAEKRWLRIYTLHLADKPCAFWIGAVYQQTFFSDFMGYDPDYALYSPGMYLFSQMMEEFCSQGIKAMDFGFSDEEWKKRFGNVVWREKTLHLFAPTPKGFSLNAKRAIALLLHEPIRAILARTELIQKVKKAWRNMTRAREE